MLYFFIAPSFFRVFERFPLLSQIHNLRLYPLKKCKRIQFLEFIIAHPVLLFKIFQKKILSELRFESQIGLDLYIWPSNDPRSLLGYKMIIQNLQVKGHIFSAVRSIAVVFQINSLNLKFLMHRRYEGSSQFRWVQLCRGVFYMYF